MRLHASWIVVSYAIGIIIGDILAMLFRPTFFESPIWLLLSLLILFFAILISKITPSAVTSALLIAALIAGALLILNRAAPSFIAANYAKTLVGKEITVTAKVIKDPEEDAGKKKLTLDVENLGKIFTTVSSSTGSTITAETTAETTAATDATTSTEANSNTITDLKRSDYITLSGTLSEGFGSYVGVIYQPEIKEIIKPEPGDLFLKFRDFFAGGIKDYLPAKEASLATGYLLGQKSGVDKSFQDSLRTVGLTHIIVASGAHLGTLIGFARKIFGRLSRFASFLSGGIAMLLFIGVTGLSASMLRAGLVVGLSLITWYFGHKVHPLRVILLAAAATLVFSPEYLLDMAWQLSFASFSGILIVAPILICIFYGAGKKPSFIGGTLISSAAAALLCTPILIFNYGSISLISIFINLLILPTVSFAMGLAFLTGLTAICAPFLADPVSFVTKLLLDYQITIVEFFGAKKEFLLELPKDNSLIFLAYLPVTILIIFWLVKTKNQEIKRLRLRNFPQSATLE